MIRSKPRAGKEAPALSHRVNAERLVLLGWPRAVLLQLAHPLIAASVYDHSNFRAAPWAAARRLKNTVCSMLALTFGNDAEREHALERIRAIHRRVHGRLADDVGPFRAGTRYSAENPALILWVHATLLESVLTFFEAIVTPLSTAERTAYCVEAAPIAADLGAQKSDVPQSWQTLRAYLRRMYGSDQIVVGTQAKALAARILSPPFGLLGAPAASLSHVLTVGTLPVTIRRQYGFSWTLSDERALTILLTSLRRLRPILPDALARWRAARRGLHATRLRRYAFTEAERHSSV